MNIRKLITELERIAAVEGDELPCYRVNGDTEDVMRMYANELQVEDAPQHWNEDEPLPRGLVL